MYKTTVTNLIPNHLQDLGKDKYKRFLNALQCIPIPGTGCHPKLLSAANYGVAAGLSGNEILSGIREHIPVGDRHVKDQEIVDAINKARSDQGQLGIGNSNYESQIVQVSLVTVYPRRQTI